MTTPPNSHSETSLSDRLRRFEARWSEISDAAIKSPETPPWVKVLILQGYPLAIGFVGMAWNKAEWFAYLTFSTTFVILALIAFRGRHTFQIQGPPKLGHQSKSKGPAPRPSKKKRRRVSG